MPSERKEPVRQQPPPPANPCQRIFKRILRTAAARLRRDESSDESPTQLQRGSVSTNLPTNRRHGLGGWWWVWGGELSSGRAARNRGVRGYALSVHDGPRRSAGAQDRHPVMQEVWAATATDPTRPTRPVVGSRNAALAPVWLEGVKAVGGGAPGTISPDPPRSPASTTASARSEGDARTR